MARIRLWRESHFTAKGLFLQGKTTRHQEKPHTQRMQAKKPESGHETPSLSRERQILSRKLQA
jgi:hypothetical protein